MSVHDTVQRLSVEAQRAIGRLYDRYAAGESTYAEFRALAVARLTQDQVRAESVALLSVAAELSRLNQQVQPTPEGLLDDPEKYAGFEVTNAEHTQQYERDPATAYGIAAAAAVTGAYATASTRGMRSAGVDYFRRVAGPDACDICLDMSDIVLPVANAESTWHHKGCQCTYQPVNKSEL